MDGQAMPSSEYPRPRSGKISAAISHCGIPRSTLYKLAGQHPGLLKKIGASTYVDYDVLDRIIDQLPLAQLKQQGD
jgi:hypothetical protein